MHSVLNEGSFMSALVDIAKDTANAAQDARNNNKSRYMYGSISRYTQKLILSFPTIADNTIPISTAQLISKAHEKNLASMFEMLFTSMSLSGNNGIEILKALHHNLSTNASIDDIIDTIEKAVGESGVPFTDSQIRDIVNELCYELKYKQKSLPVNSFSEKSLNDYIVRESVYSGTVVMEAGDNEKIYTKKDYNAAYQKGQEDERQSYRAKKEERDEKAYNNYDKKYANQTEERRRDEDYDRHMKDRKADHEIRSKERQQDQLIRRQERKQDQEIRRNEREEDRARKNYEDEVKLAQSRVKDIDYKKANELQPTLMTVTYNVLGADKSTAYDKKTFVAGIKSRLVGSDAMEIVERISATSDNKLTFKDLVRATTGEISLVKDFIAATKQAKINAKNASKRGETAKMWNLLAARAKKNKVTGTAMRSNEAASITTLIINQETVNYIVNQYKINLDSAKDAAKIMQSFNLLALVIADEANEVAKFLYDGNNSFEMVSYSALSRDQRDDKSYNKAINLINSSGR